MTFCLWDPGTGVGIAAGGKTHRDVPDLQKT